MVGSMSHNRRFTVNLLEALRSPANLREQRTFTLSHSCKPPGESTFNQTHFGKCAPRTSSPLLPLESLEFLLAGGDPTLEAREK